MNLSRADLNLFVVFEAIYAQGGVTRAAKALNLSQPTISHALGRLRAQLDDQLFVRQGQRLIPTPKAQAMIEPVRAALQLLDTSVGQKGVFDPAAATNAFSIGMRSLMESTYLVPLAGLIGRTAPGVSLSSTQFDRRQIERQLASGEVNAVIDVFLPTSANVKREHLDWAPSVVVARRGHPAVGDRIDLASYLAADHVIVTTRPQGLGPEDLALARQGQHRTIRTRCQQINAAMRLVAGSDLLLTMSETFARRANMWFDNQILAAPFKADGVDTYMYWHRNADADPANQWLRSMIRASAVEAGARPSGEPPRSGA